MRDLAWVRQKDLVSVQTRDLVWGPLLGWNWAPACRLAESLASHWGTGSPLEIHWDLESVPRTDLAWVRQTDLAWVRQTDLAWDPLTDLA